MEIYQIEVGSIISTFLFWFAIIVIIALVMGAVIWVLRIWFFMEILGGGRPNRQAPSSRQCPYCNQFTPPDSMFCKNCGARLR